MSTFDNWDIVGLVFCLSIVVSFAVYALLAWVERNHPFSHERRNSAGRRRMATDWRRPEYLPEDWQ